MREWHGEIVGMKGVVTGHWGVRSGLTHDPFSPLSLLPDYHEVSSLASHMPLPPHCDVPPHLTPRESQHTVGWKHEPK